jgi:hypothetical protein
MTISKIALQPGVYREGTSYSAEGRWFDGDKIRFRSGNAEKIGGWQRLSGTTYLGTARSLWNWITLAGDNYLGIGTNLKYYVEFAGGYNDITPIRKTVNPMLGPQPPATGNPFSTAFNTLSANINTTQQTLTLTSASSFPPTGGIIKIGTEEIFYGEVDSNTLLGLTRGYNGTTPASHLSGANVACSTIIVTDELHGAFQNDFVTFTNASGPFGGITAADVNKEYQILRYIDVDRYAVNITTLDINGDIVNVFSSSAASGGGALAIARYQVTTGLDVYVAGLGWGADPWSSGVWGRAGTIGIGEQLRLWTSENYGEDLILAPRGGGLYYWDATLGVGQRAVPLSSLASSDTVPDTLFTYQDFVPKTTNEVVASSLQRFVIAMGSNPYDPTDPDTVFDPMVVRWSDQEDPFTWVPSITNQSGEFRLSHGSYIVTANTTRQEILIWTDSALYSMQYLGAPYVWGFNILMDNLSIMSPNASITANNVTYWMGKDKFYVYSGRVETLPCALRQYIFNDLNINQAYQVFSGSNEAYNEVWWFYCSNGSTVVDKYVIYNYLENLWYYGSMNRTAWLDSPLRDYPMAAGYENRILYHELGTDDVSGESAVPITAYIQSADFDIGDGDHFAFVWRILPDINFNGSYVNQPTVKMEIRPRRNAGAPYSPADNPTVQSQDNYTNTRSYNIQEFDGQVYTRLRGRQMALRIESDQLGVAWQLGSIRADIRPDGRR